LALISTSCTFTSAVCMAAGWIMIRRGNRETHRKLMIASVIFAALFFAIYMTRTDFVGNTAFGGPESVKPYYTAFLTFHILLTILSPILVLRMLYLARKEQFEAHRKLGPWAAGVWFVTAVTGVMVYLLLFVIYPEGPTTNMFRAYWGF
jgi:putative membrane protein